MTVRRLFCPDSVSLTQLLADGHVELSAEESHYARAVLRLEDQTTVFALDGHGGHVRATLRHSGKKGALLWAQEGSREPAPESRHLHLLMPVAKGERTDWLLEKATELGIHSMTFARFARSVATTEKAQKQDRYLRVCKAAARQARHGRVPRLAHGLSLSDALAADSAPGATKLVAHPDPGAIELCHAVAPAQVVHLVIGPEGGITPDELQLLVKHDYTATTLGPHILRMETAALVALAASMLTPFAATSA